MLNCIHFICMDCSRQMLKFEDDWIIECFCKELTKVNITPQYDNIPLSQVMYFLFF
jgi:hypothetical protein